MNQGTGYMVGMGSTVVQGVVTGVTGATTAVTSAAGPIGLVLMFLEFTIGGIVSAEKAAKQWSKNFAEQNAAVKNLISTEQNIQQQQEQQLITDYEAQLQKEAQTAQIKAVGVSVGMILLVLALLYFLSKIVK